MIVQTGQVTQEQVSQIATTSEILSRGVLLPLAKPFVEAIGEELRPAVEKGVEKSLPAIQEKVVEKVKPVIPVTVMSTIFAIGLLGILFYAVVKK